MHVFYASHVYKLYDFYNRMHSLVLRRGVMTLTPSSVKDLPQYVHTLVQKMQGLVDNPS